jgi:osmotically-inducible protein OsmY
MKRTDEQVKAAVRETLFSDRRLEPREIAIHVRDGVVTLRGTVGNHLQKREAESAARRVKGVVEVDNHLRVELMDMHGRRDAELYAEIIEALDASGLIPSVRPWVRFAVVTLSGAVHDIFQREDAELIVRRVHGVRDVWNELAVEHRK